MAPQVCLPQVVELVEEAQNAQNESNYEEAEKLWRQVIQLQPKDAVAYARLGNVLFAQSRIDEGIAAYQQAIQIKPSANIYNSYADNLRWNNKPVEAMGAYKAALKLDSKSDVAHTGLGSIYFQQEKYSEAIVEFRQAIALKPSWDNYELLGDALLKAEKFDEARIAYREAIKIEPTYSWLHNKIAESFKTQGKISDAIAAYRQAINVDSGNFFAYTGLAEVLQFPNSIPVLNQYIKQDPKNDVPIRALAYVYKENQKINESADAYRQAIKVKPSADNYSSLGNILVEQNKLEEAVVALRQAIQIEANDERYGDLAEALVKQNKLSEALAACQNTIALKNVYYKSYQTCSIAGFGIYQKQGLNSVITTLRQLAVKLAPKDMAEVFVNLGYRMKNSDNLKKEDAIAIFQEALKLNPKNKQAQEAIKELQSSQEIGLLYDTFLDYNF
ncbi:MAG: tetratricopeptide repeat protein [Calothrix sp. C42_A2020_038]|nr:tetratricopeptide repeat protein [Calothrix sp. C42_A2020_038]